MSIETVHCSQSSMNKCTCSIRILQLEYFSRLLDGHMAHSVWNNLCNMAWIGKGMSTAVTRLAWNVNSTPDIGLGISCWLPGVTNSRTGVDKHWETETQVGYTIPPLS